MDNSNPYFHLVIENINRHSGHAGIRYVEELSVLEAPQLNKIKRNPQTHVLAEKPSHELEKALLALTPDVCLLTSAIEDFYDKNFEGDGYPKNIDFNTFILSTISKILENRLYWKKRHLIPQYSTDFPFVDIDSVDFEDIKRLFHIVEASSSHPNGTVDDLKDTFCQLCFEKAQIDFDNLMERLDDDITPPKIS